MNLLKYMLLLIVLLCAIPVGFLLAKLTKEELKQGRKAFKAIITISSIILIISIFLPLSSDNKQFILASTLFIALLAFISMKKEKEKVTKKKKEEEKIKCYI